MRALCVALLVGSVPFALATQPAGATFTTVKKVKVTIAPASVPSGATTSFSALVQNKSSSGKLDSVDVVAPNGVVVTSATLASSSSASISTYHSSSSPQATVVAPGTVQLRNLGLRPSATLGVTITASAPCAAGLLAWAVHASGYTVDSGSALGLDVTGSCKLSFGAAQPTDAASDEVITTSAFVPAATPVQVSILDGADNVIGSSSAPITLTSTPPVTVVGGAAGAIGGVATFPALNIATIGTYTVTATTSTPGIASAVSNSFRITSAGANCAVAACSATAPAPSGNQQSSVSAPSTTGQLYLSVGADDPSTVDCGDSWIFNHAPNVTTIDQNDVSAVKTATVTIDKSFVNSSLKTRLVLLYRVCYSSPVPFQDRLGHWVTLGLLPRCRNTDSYLYPPNYPWITVPPCVESIVKTASGDIVETLKLPASDPRFR